MAHIDQLTNYFGNVHEKPNGWVGSEIETFFVDNEGNAITIGQSQNILHCLTSAGWTVAARKGDMVTEVRKGTSKVLYELGYPNIELAVCPQEPEKLIGHSRNLLGEIYRAAERNGAYPLFAPVFGDSGNYLAIPDGRDATWLALDGKEALSPLARISAVQFTVDVTLNDAIRKLNRLGNNIGAFLEKYPQNKVWRHYVRTSPAGYRADRYGGPLEFDSLWHYCAALAEHAVVSGTVLAPFEKANLCSNDSISLFIRSVWWYFRLRRYGSNLCIEVRPLPRRSDDTLQTQLDMVLELVS